MHYKDEQQDYSHLLMISSASSAQPNAKPTANTYKTYSALTSKTEQRKIYLINISLREMSYFEHLCIKRLTHMSRRSTLLYNACY